MTACVCYSQLYDSNSQPGSDYAVTLDVSLRCRKEKCYETVDAEVGFGTWSGIFQFASLFCAGVDRVTFLR